MLIHFHQDFYLQLLIVEEQSLMSIQLSPTKNNTGGPLVRSVFMLYTDGSLQLYSSDGGNFTGTIFEFYSITLEWFIN